MAVPLVALLCLCCQVCRLVVCLGLFPLAVPLVAPRRVRRPLGALVVPWVARPFVAVCAGNARLFAIVLYWLRLCSFCVGVFVCEGVC